MATTKCKACPARFTGADAAEALEAHVAGFHPAGAPAPAPAATRATGPAVDGEARAAIKALEDLVTAFGGVVTALGERVRALEEAATEPAPETEPEPEPSEPGKAGSPPTS
ncbi:MAG: hypothetical protein AB1627_01020 [Chloroflexota bacterium]